MKNVLFAAGALALSVSTAQAAIVGSPVTIELNFGNPSFESGVLDLAYNQTQIVEAFDIEINHRADQDEFGAFVDVFEGGLVVDLNNRANVMAGAFIRVSGFVDRITGVGTSGHPDGDPFPVDYGDHYISFSVDPFMGSNQGRGKNQSYLVQFSSEPVSPSQVPLPAAGGMLLLGLGGLAMARKGKRG